MKKAFEEETWAQESYPTKSALLKYNEIINMNIDKQKLFVQVISRLNSTNTCALPISTANKGGQVWERASIHQNFVIFNHMYRRLGSMTPTSYSNKVEEKEKVISGSFKNGKRTNVGKGLQLQSLNEIFKFWR